NDLRRVIRALEVWELTGQPISAWQKEWSRDQELRIEDRGSKIEEGRELRIEDRGSKIEEGQELRIEDRGSKIEEATAGPSRSSILYPLSSILDPRCLWLDLPRPQLYAQ